MKYFKDNSEDKIYSFLEQKFNSNFNKLLLEDPQNEENIELLNRKIAAIFILMKTEFRKMKYKKFVDILYRPYFQVLSYMPSCKYTEIYKGSDISKWELTMMEDIKAQIPNQDDCDYQILIPEIAPDKFNTIASVFSKRQSIGV